MTNATQIQVIIGLISGKQLAIRGIQLFPESDIREIQLLKAKAQEELAGYSTGIGFWGSPGWVLGGAAILGSIESTITNVKIKKGIELLMEAQQKYENLKKEGVFIPVNAISGISSQDPLHWFSKTPRSINLNRLEMMERMETIQRYGIRQGDITDGIANVVTGGYAHNGDEFVWVEVGQQQIAVRWSAVETYQLM